MIDLTTLTEAQLWGLCERYARPSTITTVLEVPACLYDELGRRTKEAKAQQDCQTTAVGDSDA